MNTYNFLIILTFIVGYFFITIEHASRLSKTSIALLTAVLCWMFLFINRHIEANSILALGEHMASISQIVFFLLGALTIVEAINVHRGFRLISDHIFIRSKRTLLWVVGVITFFLSSVLDNLTTTIIMVTLMQRMIPKGQDRLLLGGAVVIAANAGGAWTPIGDVTTTMLWIGEQLSTFKIMTDLFLPSIACLIISLLCLTPLLEGEFDIEKIHEKRHIEPKGRTVFWLGISCLIFVPIFKALTGLPPFMGILLGLAVMWLFTDYVHGRHDDRYHLRIPYVMTKIDISSVLFFLGILLAVDALDTAGILNNVAEWMDRAIGNPNWIAIAIGLISAVIDNVPLVAASMGMYELSQYPTDSTFWQLIAYCAGTGGSILVIGSAAGVAFMGLERVDFFWYLRRIGFAAFVGYFAGIGVYFLLI